MSSQAEFKINHNVESNEVTIVELSKDEINELAKSRLAAEKINALEASELEKAKNAKLNLLEKLGITEDEAKLLFS